MADIEPMVVVTERKAENKPRDMRHQTVYSTGILPPFTFGLQRGQRSTVALDGQRRCTGGGQNVFRDRAKHFLVGTFQFNRGFVAQRFMPVAKLEQGAKRRAVSILFCAKYRHTLLQLVCTFHDNPKPRIAILPQAHSPIMFDGWVVVVVVTQRVVTVLCRSPCVEKVWGNRHHCLHVSMRDEVEFVSIVPNKLKSFLILCCVCSSLYFFCPINV